MEPDRRAARAAVIKKRDGTLLEVGVALEIGDVEHARFRGSLGRVFCGRYGCCQIRIGQRLAIRAQLRVLRIGRANGNGSRNRVVQDVLAAGIEGALGGHFQSGFFGGLFRGLLC